jgi:FMN reductase
MSLLLIAASPSANSRSGALLAGAAERLQLLGLAPQTLRLRDLPAQALIHADFKNERIQQAIQAVAQASLIVIATPVYKAAYSGLLKVFLDLLPQDGLRDKTVWSLATGGSLAHLLALDYALGPVLASLGARKHLDPVFATDAQLTRDASGAYRISDELTQRLKGCADQALLHLPQPELAHG